MRQNIIIIQRIEIVSPNPWGQGKTHTHQLPSATAVRKTRLSTVLPFWEVDYASRGQRSWRRSRSGTLEAKYVHERRGELIGLWGWQLAADVSRDESPQPSSPRHLPFTLIVMPQYCIFCSSVVPLDQNVTTHKSNSMSSLMWSQLPNRPTCATCHLDRRVARNGRRPIWSYPRLTDLWPWMDPKLKTQNRPPSFVVQRSLTFKAKKGEHATQMLIE